MKHAIDHILVIAFSASLLALSSATFWQTKIAVNADGWLEGHFQRGYEKRFEAELPTQTAALGLWARLKWELFRDPSPQVVVGSDGWLFTAEEFVQPKTARAFSDELANVRDRLGAHGITLMPVIVPDKARMNAHKLKRGRSQPFQNRYFDALHTIDSLGLKAIDVRPALSNANSYLRQDTHWSPDGARAVAELISVHTHDLPLSRTDVQTTQTGREAFSGDLRTFFGAGGFTPNIIETNAEIVRFETVADVGTDLFAEITPSVVLIGTSYSANPAFHFAGFLSQSLSADVANLSTVGFGPFVPMHTYLDALAEGADQPALVVWEIPERYLTARRAKK